jgi:hypothetical protein
LNTLETQQQEYTITPQAIDRWHSSLKNIKSSSSSEQFSKVEYTYGWYSASAGNNDMQGIISKVKL